MSAFRGAVDAAGLILDVPLLGEAEARERVLRSWTPGSALHALPDGRWVLVLGAPVHVRAERAPGAPVLERDGGMVTGGAAVRPGRLTECRAGGERAHALAELPRIDPGAWLDPGGIDVVALEPLDAVPEPDPVAPAERRATPDLRGAAGVGEASGRARRMLDRLKRDSDRSRARGGGGGSFGMPGAGLMARMVLRSPAQGIVGRRHLRYLEGLERSFRQGNWEAALRDAISLGGDGRGRLSLRLPKPRSGALGPNPDRSAGSRSLPWGPTVFEHLEELYRHAAERLESEGRIDEAAFVHADLLNAPNDAVALLERHGRYEMAARLAEGRDVDAGMVVRLWWLARNPTRAIAVARSRGAWADAVERLGQVAPEAAHWLRAEWVQDARAAGDHQTAVEAAWPDEKLRDGAADDLAVLRERGGATAARALALSFALRPADDDMTVATTLLRDAGPERADERAAFALALAGERAAGAVADRRLSSEVVRALLRDASTTVSLPDRDHRRTLNVLRERADPLLRADLPAVSFRAARPGTLNAGAPDEPGTLPVMDAVWLDGALLVAAGPAGLFLLGPDGRPRARWDVPAHRLVVGDAGGVVLAAAFGESTVDVHRLTLADRRVRRWATLGRCGLVESFDGRVLLMVDRDGLAGVDTIAPRPAELWREFNAHCRMVSISRSPTSLAAVVDVPLQGITDRRSIELWRWDLPAALLRVRHVHDQPALRDDSLVSASGRLLCMYEQPDGGLALLAGGEGRDTHQPVSQRAVLRVSGDVYALDDGEGAMVYEGDGDEIARLTWPQPLAGLRQHAGTVTLWDGAGRVLVVDISSRRLLARLRATR